LSLRDSADDCHPEQSDAEVDLIRRLTAAP
jgi:hypothetical protein